MGWSKWVCGSAVAGTQWPTPRHGYDRVGAISVTYLLVHRAIF